MTRDLMYLILNAKGDTKDKKSGKKLDDMSDEELTVMCSERLKKQKAHNEANELVANAAREGFTDGNRECVWNEESGTFVCTDIELVDNEGDDDDNEPQPLTEDQIRNELPELWQDVEYARTARKQRRGELVKTVLANESNPFTEDELNAKGDGELEKLAQFAAPKRVPAANFAVAGVGPGVAANERPELDQEPLVMPTINYAEPKD